VGVFGGGVRDEARRSECGEQGPGAEGWNAFAGCEGSDGDVVAPECNVPFGRHVDRS